MIECSLLRNCCKYSQKTVSSRFRQGIGDYSLTEPFEGNE